MTNTDDECSQMFNDEMTSKGNVRNGKQKMLFFCPLGTLHVTSGKVINSQYEE